MDIPQNLLYTEDHEWIKIEDDSAIIGITDYAQSELGDIIFIEFPNLNTSYKAGDSIGTIEAVKTVADIYIPIDATILEVNTKLEDNPDLVNLDPYNDGWIIKIKNFNKQSNNLLTDSQYKKLIN